MQHAAAFEAVSHLHPRVTGRAQFQPCSAAAEASAHDESSGRSTTPLLMRASAKGHDWWVAMGGGGRMQPERVARAGEAQVA